MVFFQRMFALYISKSFQVAISAVCLLWVNAIFLGFPTDNKNVIFVFFAVLFGYQLAKNPVKMPYFFLKKNLFLVFFTVFFLWSVNFFQKIIILTIFFLFVGYCFPLFFGMQLRMVPYLKIFVVGLCWALACLALPVLGLEKIPSVAGLVFAQNFLWISVLILPFDIRDMQQDARAGLKTFPLRLGIFGAKILGVLGVLVFLVLGFYAFPSVKIRLIQTLISIATVVFLIFSTEKQKTYYASFWVESLPMFYLIITLFCYHFL